MRRLEHCNIVKLKYFFYSSGEKVSKTWMSFTSSCLPNWLKQLRNSIRNYHFSFSLWMCRDDLLHKFIIFSPICLSFVDSHTTQKNIFCSFFLPFWLSLLIGRWKFCDNTKYLKLNGKIATGHASRFGNRDFCWSTAASGQIKARIWLKQIKKNTTGKMLVFLSHTFFDPPSFFFPPYFD